MYKRHFSLFRVETRCPVDFLFLTTSLTEIQTNNDLPTEKRKQRINIRLWRQILYSFDKNKDYWKIAKTDKANQSQTT